MDTEEIGKVILIQIDEGVYEYCEVICQEPNKTVVKILRNGEIRTIYLLNLN